MSAQPDLVTLNVYLRSGAALFFEFHTEAAARKAGEKALNSSIQVEIVDQMGTSATILTGEISAVSWQSYRRLLKASRQRNLIFDEMTIADDTPAA